MAHSQSAYLEANCVNKESLVPFTLIVIGIIIQTFISFLITLKPDNLSNDGSKSNLSPTDKEAGSTNDIIQDAAQKITLKQEEDDEDDDEDDENTENPKEDIINAKLNNSKFYKYVTLFLIIWQIITMIIIFIFDVIKLAEFSKNFAHYDSWQEFKCFGSILFISSNSQTILINFITMIIVYGQMNIVIGWKLINISKKIWFSIIVLILLLYISFILIFAFVGFFVYIWITVPCIALAIWIPKLLCCGCKCCFSTIYQLIVDGSYELIMMPIIIIFVYSLIGLTMINFYSGVEYIDSVRFVLEERDYEIYFNGIGNSFENVLRFITVFIG